MLLDTTSCYFIGFFSLFAAGIGREADFMGEVMGGRSYVVVYRCISGSAEFNIKLFQAIIMPVLVTVVSCRS